MSGWGKEKRRGRIEVLCIYVRVHACACVVLHGWIENKRVCVEKKLMGGKREEREHRL